MRPWALQSSEHVESRVREIGGCTDSITGRCPGHAALRVQGVQSSCLFLVKTAEDPATSRDSGAALNGLLQPCVKGALSTGLIVQGLLCLFLKVASFLYCRTYFCKIRMI